MRIRARVIVKNFELEERRKALGMTQVNFADICGIMLSRFSDIEQMKVKPTEEEAKMIALELEADVQTLFPQGYERIVDIFSRPLQRITDYTPALLEDDAEVRLLEQNNAKITVEKLLDELSPKERKILKLCSAGEKTLDEIGRSFGVTGTRVKQIQERALDRCRNHLNAKAERGIIDITRDFL